MISDEAYLVRSKVFFETRIELSHEISSGGIALELALNLIDIDSGD